jgi:hypothetical protein
MDAVSLGRPLTKTEKRRIDRQKRLKQWEEFDKLKPDDGYMDQEDVAKIDWVRL